MERSTKSSHGWQQLEEHSLEITFHERNKRSGTLHQIVLTDGNTSGGTFHPKSVAYFLEKALKSELPLPLKRS